MSQVNKVYVGDTGTELIFDIGIDSSEVKMANIVYKKANGESGKWAANPVPNSTSINYFIQDLDLSVPGVYKLQPEVTLNSGWKGRGEIVDLYVSETI